MSHTWLSAPASVWRRQFPDAPVPFKMLARYLAPLTKVAPTERIVAELAAYLRKTPPQYLNLAKFAATFGGWATPEPVRPQPKAPTTKRVVTETNGRYRLQEVGLDDPRPAA